MSVKPLNTAEKDQIITDYLEKIYGKTLSADQKEMIVTAPQTDNALYIKALLDEVYNILPMYRWTFELWSPTPLIQTSNNRISALSRLQFIFPFFFTR